MSGVLDLLLYVVNNYISMIIDWLNVTYLSVPTLYDIYDTGYYVHAHLVGGAVVAVIVW